MSTKNAGLAKKLGHRNIRVYLDGEPAWAKAGLPTYATNDFIMKGNVVLIDLRASSKAVAGRIRGPSPAVRRCRAGSTISPAMPRSSLQRQ
jgi:rhodanese-related sulfurtransferase